MSILVSDIITRARKIWKESTEGDILTDASCLLFLSDGYLRLRGIRTEIRYDDNSDPIDYADITTSIPIDVKFRPVLVDYLVGRGFEADSNLQNHEARASRHLANFEALAKVV